MTTPYLLQDLTPDQRLRVLCVDYVTSSGYVPPEQWIVAASSIETYLRTGEAERTVAEVKRFPKFVDENS